MRSTMPSGKTGWRINGLWRPRPLVCRIHVASNRQPGNIVPTPNVTGTNAVSTAEFASRDAAGSNQRKGKVQCMSENMSAGNEPEKAASELGTPSPEGGGATFTNSQAISLCATGLLICFFLPWAQILGQSISGFDLQKLGGNQKALWLIPISCIITIVAGFAKQSQKSAALFAGVLPFFALAYWLYQLGSDLMKILEIGAYFGLGLGLVLILLSATSKK
jgi:hypothetical protein